MIVRGARVVTPGRDLGVADVRIENGVIAEVGANVLPTDCGTRSRRRFARAAHDDRRRQGSYAFLKLRG